jgi:hypothetical protein
LRGTPKAAVRGSWFSSWVDPVSFLRLIGRIMSAHSAFLPESVASGM